MPDHAAVGPPAAGTARTIDDQLLVACGLALGAGLIHVVAAVEHLDEYTLYSLFFVMLALAQFALGIALYRSPSPRLVMYAAVGSLLVVGLWLVSRTVGLPIGPSIWTPDPVGAIDTIASGDEIALALLMGFRLRPSSGGTGAIVFRRVVTGAGL